MSKFEEFREKYPRFIYKDFTIEQIDSGYRVTYFFSIPGLCDFHPVWEFPTKGEVDMELLSTLVFHLGMVETISYWKCTCSKVMEVACGELTASQKEWWEKLYYYGLGEFMYRNGIEIERNHFIDIKCKESAKAPLTDQRSYQGCLVPVGGGKDSVVSLELMAGEPITTFSINGNATTRNVIQACEHKVADYSVTRKLDSQLIALNAEGFLNGHTPFSALVAFSSVISAFLNGIKYVVLSNETSANETTVKDSFVNHQYSKSYEFEEDFTWYLKSLTDSDIHYFSLLRPLTEIQIAELFAKYPKYHGVFRSCNAGSKKGIWCCGCSKCLFVYIILAPFLSQDALDNIFGENLLNKEQLDRDFRELTGIEENKPFECVGTRKEVLVALKEYLNKGGHSLLTDRYQDIILAESGTIQDLLTNWTSENNVPEKYSNIIRGMLKNEYNK